ncbi:hypothetical protein ACHAQJ_007947 [Trichoderma viride]
MNISGSLFIKYGAIGGSGKGSFADPEKFKESDLNFFISAKVINQSINIKMTLSSKASFRDEFNAPVSMKVVNKNKRMAVKAEAEIVLSVGTADIQATANADMRKSNFSSQTETTIQYSDLPLRTSCGRSKL